MPSFQIKNAVALVTGTNKATGIGRAIVEALLSAGAAKVYATARDASQLDDLVALYPRKVVAVALDVTDLSAIAALPSLYPDVTLIVNNSGYGAWTSSIDDVEKSFLEMQVNYIAPLAIVKSFAPVFAALKNSSDDDNGNIKPSAVVNINSITSFINSPVLGTYSASKAAAHSLTQAQRRDLSNNTLVIGVYPGPIDTDAVKDLPLLQKEPPSVVGKAIVHALEHGIENVFPDKIGRDQHHEWTLDAKAVEIKTAAMASTQ